MNCPTCGMPMTRFEVNGKPDYRCLRPHNERRVGNKDPGTGKAHPSRGKSRNKRDR